MQDRHIVLTFTNLKYFGLFRIGYVVPESNLYNYTISLHISSANQIESRARDIVYGYLNTLNRFNSRIHTYHVMCLSKNKDCRVILMVGSENSLWAQSTSSQIPALITIQRRFAFPLAQAARIGCEQWNKRQYPESEHLGVCVKAHQRPLCQEPRSFGKNPPSHALPVY